MTAAQVIEEIRRLPHEEQEEVCAFVWSGGAHSGRFQPAHGADPDRAKVIIGELFEHHARLFCTLAKQP
jgi:hypothetical protein